ncbi:hypothetical protein F4859DRAFT_240691 [Xylaria cf. heliscus]|nr:hypothetical protein F4859DRAFT_240691 [Xylaria cf. heliscus]
MIMKMAQHRQAPSPYVKEEQHGDPVSRIYSVLASMSHALIVLHCFALPCLPGLRRQIYLFTPPVPLVRYGHPSRVDCQADLELRVICMAMGDGCSRSASSVSCRGLQTKSTLAVPNTRKGLESRAGGRPLPENAQGSRKLSRVKTRAASTGITGERCVSQRPGVRAAGGSLGQSLDGLSGSARLLVWNPALTQPESRPDLITAPALFPPKPSPA